MKNLNLKNVSLSLGLLMLGACEVAQVTVNEDASENRLSQNNFSDVSDFPFDQIQKIAVTLNSDGSVESLSITNSADAAVVFPAAYDLDQVQAIKKGNFVVVNFPRVDGSVATLVLSKASDGQYQFHKMDGLALSYADLDSGVSQDSGESIRLNFFDAQGKSRSFVAGTDSQNRLVLKKN